MKNIIFISIVLLISQSSWAYLLIDKDYRLKNPEKTKVNISSEGCTGNGIPDSELKDAINKSIAIWNEVPESRLRLEYDGRTSASIVTAVAPKGTILIGCTPLSGTSGVTNNDNANGSSRIRLNSNELVPGSYYPDGLSGLIAHEMGHSIGLHHSKDRGSVMTYEDNNWGAMPTYLSQDDVDGVIYLYPNKEELGGLLPACSSFAGASDQVSTKSNAVLINLIIGFLTALFISALIKIILKVF